MNRCLRLIWLWAAYSFVLLVFLGLLSKLTPQDERHWDSFHGQLELSPEMFDPQPLTVPVQSFKPPPAD
jgi:hypothetical protein